MAPSSSLHIVTPLIRSDRLTELMGGVPVFLKLENLQPSGSFKIRGIGHTCSEAKANGAVKIVGRYVQNLQSLPFVLCVLHTTFLELFTEL